MGGGIQKRIYLVEHQSGLDANQKRQSGAQDAGGWIQRPDQEHLLGQNAQGQTTECGTNRVFGLLIV